MSSVPHSSMGSHERQEGDPIYQNERTLVLHVSRAEGKGLICKKPIGPKAAARLRHERRILERLAGIAGVPQPVACPFPDAIAFEDIGATTLADAMRQRSLDQPAWVALMLELVDILAAVHRAGVVHKDISPANILLGPERKPLLIDFDLATTSAEERPGFIQPQEIAGTLAYIAPEQTGRTGRAVDQRADLYALGAVLYELCVGHPPFDDRQGDSLQLIHDVLARAPASPAELNPKIPQALSGIILHLLEKEPDRRYQSAEGLKIDLLRLRDMLARGDESGTFPLGQHDYPQRLSPPSQLVGRATEIGILQAAFDNALHGRGSGVLVSGAPGVGKSALINELRPIVTARRGWFVAGKFDQYRQDAGADATVQALRALVRLMLAEPEAELADLRRRVLACLGPNAGLTAGALPEFGASFGILPEMVAGDPVQTAKRMAQAAFDLLRAVASPQRPVVMVVDDLQWAPATALDFIDAVLNAKDLCGVLLVGSYRENAVDGAHPLTAMLARWKRLQAEPMQLRLDNLPPDDLATLLATMLHLAPEPAQELAVAVAARTGGNPFDTVELVNALRHDDVLTLGAGGWRWDVTAIRRHVGKGEVIDLLTARIARMPAATRSLLEVMACLGGEVEPAMLAAALDVSTTEIESPATPALEDGLLVMEDVNSSLRFRHDRVQQAALHLSDAAALGALHLALGRRLGVLPQFAATAAEQYLFAIDAIDNKEERRRVIGLMHDAAMQARRATNYGLAQRYLTTALSLLETLQSGEAEPGADNALFIALETELHAVFYSLGHLESADAVYRALERRCLDPLVLADAGCVQISSLGNRGQMGQAMDLGLDVLRRLDIEPPPDVAAESGAILAEVARWIFAEERSADATRREADEPRVLAVAKLIDNLQVPAFYTNPALHPWLILQSERLWEESGPSAVLMASLNSIPVLLIALSRDYSTANRMARHLLAVGEARGYEPATSLTRYIFASSVQHWFNSLEECNEEAQRAREGLLRAGKFDVAGLGYNTSIAALLDCAPTLDACATEVDAALGFATRTGNGYAEVNFLSYRQLIRALRNVSLTPGSFDDGEFSEAAHAARVTGNVMATGFFHVSRALCAALFDDAGVLAAHTAAAMPLVTGLAGYYPIALTHTLRALSLADQIKSASGQQRAALLAELDQCREWLSQRAIDAPMNFLHLLKWIDAERAWAMEDFRGAMTGFDIALCAAASRQRPWHRALMTERAGLCHLAHGLQHSGRGLLAEARDLYEAWGASAKVQEMARQHDFLSSAGQRRKADRQSSNGSISTDSLDLVGVLRASQALSSETSFPRLRVRIAQLLSELTGATDVRGVLWHEDLQEWCMPPPLDEGENGKPIPVEEAGRQALLPLSAFNYVVRTRKPLLVDDALRDDRFNRDPYFADIACCSLLGMPILNQGVLRLVLLMENRLSHGAFSTERLEAVNLIAGQLAVSVDNALLYASLERKVAERTEALEAANQRLAALSVTDALTGLANRRRFNEVLEAEWLRALRPQMPLGVAMIDIDQFKRYNDHYGHQGGDDCLRKVAAALKTSIRGDSDLVARYGGEEFVMVLPGADLGAAQAVAERARSSVEALHEPHEKSGNGIVTISAGVATTVPSAESDAEYLVELADAALYRAKKNGRNQVVGSREN